MEDLLIQILDELKSINKKLDAVTPSLKLDSKKITDAVQNYQKANHDTF